MVTAGKSFAHVCAGLVLCLGILGVPRTTSGQEELDHLMCYDVTDATEFNGTQVAIETEQFGSLGGCKIRRLREFCVPATKEVLTVGPGVEPVPFQGSPAAGDYLCYKIRCPAAPPVTDAQGVMDQFGNRQVEQFRVSRLCTPAMKDQCGNPQRTIFAREDQQGCQQFSNDEFACEQAWQFSRGTGEAVSCFFGINVNGGQGCFGCGPNNEAGGACENSCEGTPTPTCRDPSRSIFLSSRNNGCRYFSNVPAACELGWQISRGTGEPTSCFLGRNVRGDVGCFGCGPSNQDGGVCYNTCQ